MKLKKQYHLTAVIWKEKKRYVSKCPELGVASFGSTPYGNKWPKLQELHARLFRKGFDNAHNALADVRACSKCYFELRRIGVMA